MEQINSEKALILLLAILALVFVIKLMWTIWLWIKVVEDIDDEEKPPYSRS